MLHELNLNYTIYCYRMHDHLRVSHEKDNFNKHLRDYRFCSAEVDSSVKNQVLEVLEKQGKKT